MDKANKYISMAEEPKTLNEPAKAPEETISEGIVFCPSFLAAEKKAVKPTAVREKAVGPTSKKEIEHLVPVPAKECESVKPVTVQGKKVVKEGERVVKPAAEKKSTEAQKPNDEKPTLHTNKPAESKKVKRKNSNKKAKAMRAQKTKKVFKGISNLRLAIFAEGYPNILLDNNEIQRIQEDLLKKVEAQKHKAVKPCFFGATTNSGYLMLECANEETAEWVKSLEGFLAPIRKYQLKIIAENLLLKKYTVKISVPKCEGETVGTILNLLQAQNKGLFTSQWKILQTTDRPQMTDLKFSIDPESVETLAKDLSRLNYKWGQISFALEEEKNVSLKRKKKLVPQSQKKAKKRSSKRNQQKGYDASFSEQEKAILNMWFQHLDQRMNYFANPWGEGPSHLDLYQNWDDNMSGRSYFQDFESEGFDEDSL